MAGLVFVARGGVLALPGTMNARRVWPGDRTGVSHWRDRDRRCGHDLCLLPLPRVGEGPEVPAHARRPRRRRRLPRWRSFTARLVALLPRGDAAQVPARITAGRVFQCRLTPCASTAAVARGLPRCAAAGVLRARILFARGCRHSCCVAGGAVSVSALSGIDSAGLLSRRARSIVVAGASPGAASQPSGPDRTRSPTSTNSPVGRLAGRSTSRTRTSTGVRASRRSRSGWTAKAWMRSTSRTSARTAPRPTASASSLAGLRAASGRQAARRSP